MPAVIPLIIAGTSAASIYGAKKASDASRDAARVQVDSTNRAADLTRDAQRDALAFQREQWQQGQANMAPYLNMGRQALGTLGNMMGFQSSGAGGGASGFGGGGFRPTGGNFPPTGGSPMPGGGGGGQGPTLGNPSVYRPPTIVQMRLPDGRVTGVPTAMVPHLKARRAMEAQ